MNINPLLWIAVGVNVVSSAVNFFVFLAAPSTVLSDFGTTRVDPVELTAAERTYFWVDVAVPAMDVELRTLSSERWAEERARMKVEKGDILRGYAHVERSPCRIVVPAGWKLRAYPKLGRAEWADPRNAETLAHELIHCVRGRWHPE